MSLGGADLIAEAWALANEPVSLDGWVPPEVETHEQLLDAEEEERARRAEARVQAYIAERTDCLLLLRHVRASALARAAEYAAEAARWQARAKDRQGLAAYCERVAREILLSERAACGGQPGEPYRVEQASGLKMGLRISRSVLVPDVSALPAEYVRTRVEHQPDKVEIGKVLKAGGTVPGATLGTTESVDWGR